MGVTMSICLSFVGNFMGFLQSGKFSLVGYLISVSISTVISVIIGLLIPMKKIGDAAVRAAELKPFTVKAKLLEALISDCIYTPILTASMVAYEYFTMRAHASPEALEHMPTFFQMFIGSFFACMIVGYTSSKLHNFLLYSLSLVSSSLTLSATSS